MDYQGNIIRPPSEANSIILQVTTGCSHNACTFCGAYRGKPFTTKPWSTINNDLDFAARWCQRQKTLFLADGDALAMDHDRLIHLLQQIQQRLPWVRRVASYAAARNLETKSDEQLCCYRSLGLSRLYLGLESGYDPTLRAIAKGVDSTAMIKAATRIRGAGFFLSVTSLLGIAGAKHSMAHGQATAAVLNQMAPNQIAILTLMILENTPLHRQMQQGRFKPVDQEGLFHELRALIAGLHLSRTQLQANHASNYFSLNGRLPKDQETMLATIDRALAGSLQLKQEQQRLL